MRTLALVAVVAAALGTGCGGYLRLDGGDCGPEHQQGQCRAGLICVTGDCVDVGVREPCSVTNPFGTCPKGKTCNGDSCVSAAACGPDQPFGACPIGHDCVDGVCKPAETVCSAEAKNGSCPLLKTCRNGVCSDPICGNAVIEPGEDCEGINLGGAECDDAGYTRGILGCDAPSCRFSTQFCSRCGDGVVGFGEECEGSDLHGFTCQQLGVAGSGELSCTDQCEFDTSTCAGCGNGVKSPAEECDASDPAFSTDCSTVDGFTGGFVSCVGCVLVTAACTYCGDGSKNGNEDCEGTQGLPVTCQDVNPAFPPGGTVGCGSTCRYDTASCGSCGDGVKSSDEQCDPGDGGAVPPDFDGKTCVDFGFTDPNTLKCTVDCRLDRTGCGGGCLSAGAPCSSDAQCCGQFCRPGIQPGTGICYDATGCFDNGQSCTYSGQCCSLFCSAGGQCAAGTCKTVGQSCSSDRECCGDVCSGGGQCESVGSCDPSGETCSQNSECCTANCSGGHCPLYPLCRVDGEICRDDVDCCTRKCELVGNSTQCVSLTTTFPTALPTSGQVCSVLGEMCDTNPECCSNACRLIASTNPSTKRCEFLGSCRPIGELCTRDSDCCSYDCVDTPEGVTRCGPFQGCVASPDIDPLCPERNFPGCHLQGGDLKCCARRGEMCQSKNDCCEGDRCDVAVGGAKRCLRSGACFADGEICAVPDDCCGGVCVQHSDGLFRCGAEGTTPGCVPLYEICSGSGDCCDTGAICFDFGNGPRCWPDTSG